jgi:hypothetical protein
MVLENFEVTHTQEYGHKHFFGFNDISNSDDTLFICLVRNPYNWLNSLRRIPHHIPKSATGKNSDDFLNNEIWSMIDHCTDENLKDRNIYTKERYKNIFELRYTKIRFMTKDLPKKVKHCILIRYEDLLNDYTNTMNKIKNCGLIVRENINFPVNNTTKDFKHKGNVKKNKNPTIEPDKIFLHKDYNQKIEDTLLYTPTKQFMTRLTKFVLFKKNKR